MHGRRRRSVGDRRRDRHLAPAHVGKAKAIGLGPPAIAALDLAGYKRARDGRRALRRAAERIVRTDYRYEAIDVRPGVYVSISVERAPHAGWRILAVRRTAEGRRARQEVVRALAR